MEGTDLVGPTDAHTYRGDTRREEVVAVDFLHVEGKGAETGDRDRPALTGSTGPTEQIWFDSGKEYRRRF